ncbi:MAG: KEOPS complex subunit Cgi121 [Halobacteriaceae archaeon]
MKLVEGVAAIGDVDASGVPRHPDVDSFVATLAAIGTETGCAVQPFDARLIVDSAHLRSAVEHANRAVARGDAVADDRAVEILCYAAGRRQIQEAMTLGVDAGVTPVVVVVDDGTLGHPADPETAGDEAAGADRVADHLAPEPTLDRIDTDRVREFFEIGDAELGAVEDGLSLLVRERVALLDVEK